MTVHQLHQQKSSASEMEESEVAQRLRLSSSQLRRLLALCANSLSDAVRATEELTDRMAMLRDELESMLPDGQRRS
jgi:hypothetical protein